MKESLVHKLQHLSERYEEIGFLLSDNEIISNQDKFRNLSKEYAELEPVVQAYESFTEAQGDFAEAELLLKDEDPEMREMGQEEYKSAKATLETLEAELQVLLLPKDPNDGRNIILEIRAGTGGDEAAIFSGDLYRMYSRYAETQGFRVEVLNTNNGDHGGYKEIVVQITGDKVYGQLR